MRVAIPRKGEWVAPCFEYCVTMAIFTVGESGPTAQVDFPLQSQDFHWNLLALIGVEDPVEQAAVGPGKPAERTRHHKPRCSLGDSQ